MILTPDDYAEAAQLARHLAQYAGDEQAVIELLMLHAQANGIGTTRATLAAVAVATYAHWITPHEVGAPAPVTIPTTEGDTP